MSQLWKTLGKNVRYFHKNKQTSHNVRGGGAFWKYPNWCTMFFLMIKMLLRSGVTTIFDIYLDFFKFPAINVFWRVFSSKKYGHCWVYKICHLCLEKCSNYGKHWVKMSVISTKINKLGTRGEGGCAFWKYPNWCTMFFLMKKMLLRSGVTTIFAIYLDFF